MHVDDMPVKRAKIILFLGVVCLDCVAWSAASHFFTRVVCNVLKLAQG